MDMKMVSPYNECCIGKFPGLCTICFKTSTRYLKFMLYHIVIWIFEILLMFPIFMPKLCSGGFKVMNNNLLYLYVNVNTVLCAVKVRHTPSGISRVSPLSTFYFLVYRTYFTFTV